MKQVLRDSYSLLRYIHGSPIFQVCRIITDMDGRPRIIKPVILVLEDRSKPFRIRGKVLDALQVIDPILQHDIAVAHLPARPHLIHHALEGCADLVICLVLTTTSC